LLMELGFTDVVGVAFDLNAQVGIALENPRHWALGCVCPYQTENL
jgi:hypothetical protein